MDFARRLRSGRPLNWFKETGGGRRTAKKKRRTKKRMTIMRGMETRKVLE